MSNSKRCYSNKLVTITFLLPSSRGRTPVSGYCNLLLPPYLSCFLGLYSVCWRRHWVQRAVALPGNVNAIQRNTSNISSVMFKCALCLKSAFSSCSYHLCVYSYHVYPSIPNFAECVLSVTASSFGYFLEMIFDPSGRHLFGYNHVSNIL